MIKVQGIKKSFGEKTIFENVSFTINPKEKIGLIGKNGSGKTTLLKIIVGKLEADQGKIILDKHERVGYLPQTIEEDFEKTVKEFFSDGKEIKDWQIKKSLGKLGIHDIDLKRKLKTFSGGEMTRIALAKVLIQEPTILLLDEPTNNLDLEGILYLERFLSRFRGGVLLVSHDRNILDQIVSKIIELQLMKEGKSIRIYSGNFSAYKAIRQKEIEKQKLLYELQQRKIKKIKERIQKLKEKAKKMDRSVISELTKDGRFLNSRGTKFARRAKAEEKRLQKLLESEEKIKKLQKEKELRIFFDTSLKSGQRVVKAENISFDFAGKTLFTRANIEVYGKDRIAILGPNGSGKTTFLKILLGEIKVNQGEVIINPSAKIGYLPQETHFEDYQKTVLEEFEKGLEIPEYQARRILGRFLFSGEDQTKKLKDLSLGERRKLYLAKIFASQANFLVLDEPTNHLDIPSIEAIERALSQFEGGMIVISHDRYFLKNIGIKRFFYLKEGNFKEFYSLRDIERKLK